MPVKILPEQLLSDNGQIPVIDVRSPAEFTHGHIPGAINIPLFSNHERAKVGSRYKKSGREFAIELGLELIGPKLVNFVRQAKHVAVNKQLVVHCWRGGMRSASMAWLFESAGLRVKVLDGGYKAYRKYIRQQFLLGDKLLVLGGYTGSGKTDILYALKQKGEQVIDLEGIAHHKGSAFGGIGQENQPTNEQFENNLAEEWMKLDKDKLIWIEDESITIGSNGIPDTLYQLMRIAPVLRVNVPKPEREKRLINEYAGLDKALLENAILRIRERLGGLNTKIALDALNSRDYQQVASLTLDYYDKAYLKGISKRNPNTIIHLDVEKDNPHKTAQLLIDVVNKNNIFQNHGTHIS